MPRGVGKLTCLVTLMSYMVRKEADIQVGGKSGSRIEELAALNSLQVLSIKQLQNVRTGIEDAERAKLKDKQNLRDLYLFWSSGEDDKDNDMVLEGLQPNPSLRKLEITGFSSLNFPKWILSTSNCFLPNLVSLKLFKCNSLEQLPALGMLPCLMELKIWQMKSVKYLGGEFYYQQEEKEEGNSTRNSATSPLFPLLVRFSIINMESLVEWVASSSYFNVVSFPLLEMLHIQGCRELRTAPNSFPSLKKLVLWETKGKAVNSILSAMEGGCLTFLTSIEIKKSSELINLPLGVLLQNNSPNLRFLQITDCPKFEGFLAAPGDDLNNSNSSLCSLMFENCHVLKSLPDLQLWTSLRELIIWNCTDFNETSLSVFDTVKVSLRFKDSRGKWVYDQNYD